MRKLLGALVVAAALAPAVARAQDAIRVTEADVAQNASWGDKADKLVVLENVKFKYYSRPNVYTVGSLPPWKLNADPDRTSEMARLAGALVQNRTVAGVQLKEKSNLRVTGYARDNSDGVRYIEVTDVQKLPDDVDQFTGRAKSCKTPGEFMALADEARKVAERFGDADLRAWTLKTYETALKQKQDALARDASYAKNAIELARQFKSLAQNPNLGILLLNSVWGDAATNAADKDATQKVLLDELEAAQYQGKWVPREEFKRALGYVPQGRDQNGKTIWVRRERVEFQIEMGVERPILAVDPNPRKGSAFLYEQAAAKGDLALGMYKTEVYRTKGYGFPDFVDRIEDKTSSTLSWDQWIMGDGTRLYFVNGVLYKIHPKSDPWVTVAPPQPDQNK